MKLHNLKPASGANGREKESEGEKDPDTEELQPVVTKVPSLVQATRANHGFEGGQMPLQRRLPKFGFNNINRVEYKAINISTLQELSEKIKVDVINIDIIVEAGLASKNERVKILGNGTLTTKLDVTAHAFSKSAIAQIEAQQGKATKI